MIEKYIKIAEVLSFVCCLSSCLQNLKTLKNFQTLFAVLTGLTTSSVTRLNQTWTEVTPRFKEIHNDLLAIMSRESNFKTYREFLRYAALPCIPFLGECLKDAVFLTLPDVILKDVLTIEEQHPDTVNGLINFQKRQHLFRAITTLQGYQQRPFNLQPVHQIATFLNNFPRKDEKELYELSHKLEPKR